MRLVDKVVTVTLCLLSAPVVASAQETPAEPVAGERVYVITGGRRLEGTLVALTDSQVVLNRSGETLVRARPAEIFRHAGRLPAGQRILKGAGIGAATGFGVGAVIGFASGDDEPGFMAFTAEEKALAAGVVLGGVGLVTGGIIGGLRSGDRWERVELRPHVTVGPARLGGGLVLGLEARF